MLEQIKAAARKAGEIIKNADRSEITIDAKEGRGNFVTRYDRMIQDVLEKELLRILPDAYFLGEEGFSSDTKKDGKVFIVDPIDGTVNFIRDLKASVVSIGLADKGEMVLGVVYNPYTDDMYWAEKGKGAYCNGKRLHVSDNDLENSIVMTGTTPYVEELREITIQKIGEYLEKALDLRRSGSAVQDLCNLAEGKVELFFEYRLGPWDYAASSLLITEAGGKVSTVDGKPLDLFSYGSIMAQGTGIHLEKL